MGTSVRFWNRIAERYAKQPIADEDAYQHKLDKVRDCLNADHKVLEFGCGTGSTALLLAPGAGDYKAIDVSPKMIEIAQRKLASNPIDNLSFEISALEDFQAEKQSFDMILGMSILHLLEDPQAAISRVFELLKPGGIFVSSTACLGDNMGWFRYVGPVGSFLGLIPEVRVFSRADLQNSLKGAGFDIEYQFVPEGKSIACFLVARRPLANTKCR
ncbi:class I SAM-dependent methyltransferase [Pseudomaricurvus alkylphenolicus]|jgi:ubiquinone/menaquinone biosynthesis C-methylase UbiE|uniref:class I SAM-dependent methyltransferase n=1 Tax=Pseudomaricurvus alkylphenolicus TaxID=1306991 RepID=UPI00141FAE25|nr:class I SAM-dependent methyltransferase [Pseudomaricurvus alkylphenolicus]NIB41750.1 class I SAM-dependent methyltransferase [Pseudomaricurvus alkylphenolicus]